MDRSLRWFYVGMGFAAASYFLRHEPPVFGLIAAVAALACFIGAWRGNTRGGSRRGPP